METAKTAVLSECGRYRYELTRSWGDNGVRGRVCWIMLNPSTADAEVDDPTIRKCIGFSTRWGFERLVVVNLFAYRSTYPSQLMQSLQASDDVVGPENDSYIVKNALRSEFVVCAWGSWGSHGGRGEAVKALVPSGLRRHLGLTLTGDPKHPVRLGYDTPLTLWN